MPDPLIQAVHRKRQRQGLSLRQLSQVLGVSFSSLARYERGAGAPDAHVRRLLQTYCTPEAVGEPCQCGRCRARPPAVGWQCPGCGRCYAPTLRCCPACPTKGAIPC